MNYNTETMKIGKNNDPPNKYPLLLHLGFEPTPTVVCKQHSLKPTPPYMCDP